ADHDVLGLDVAVDDPFVVREVDRVADSLQEHEEFRAGETLAHLAPADVKIADDLLQRSPLEELHREEDLPSLVDRDLVDGGNARVLELARDLRLLHEAGEVILALCDRRQDHFDRDAPPEVAVEREEDLTHAPFPDFALDHVLSLDLGRRDRESALRGEAAELDPGLEAQQILDAGEHAARSKSLV